jgi:NADH:ubiquinone reductase (H+-translocating)
MGGNIPHVVMVGGGLGGLATAKALRNAPVHVTLIDRSNHHLFQPLLYRVATSVLTPGQIGSRLIVNHHSSNPVTPRPEGSS